ncbi:MAG: hypothetical protein H6605_00535 [Flavobacteriales bacterium]|nr:hypothetical protein [Flavobacteriales bacterium]
MKTSTIIAGIIGGIAFFIAGFLIYGMVLSGYMEENLNTGVSRPMEEMVWWSLVLSNLIWGYIYALIFDWSGIKGWMAGLQKGAFLGLLINLSFGFGLYAMSTWYENLSAVAVDSIATAAMGAIGGAVVGWWLGRGSGN